MESWPHLRYYSVILRSKKNHENICHNGLVPSRNSEWLVENSSTKSHFGPNFSMEDQQIIRSLLFKFKNTDQYEN